MRRRILLDAGGVSPDGITYGYVDMGLSVKWATFDIGATKVGEYGKYFQWGDIIGYTKNQVGSGTGQKYFDWNDYKYCNGSYNTLTKYNTDETYGTVDNKAVLESTDDAATFNMGTGWRMPTEAEYQELIDACNQTWDSTNKWCIFTLKTDETKQLVFPASGNCRMGNVGSQGSSGAFWSSSLYTSNPSDGRRLLAGSGFGNMGIHDRCFGFCVRGVWPKQ